MNRARIFHKTSVGIISFCLLAMLGLLLGGCSGPKKDVKDPFFEEWRVKAEASKGHSPGKPPPEKQPSLETTVDKETAQVIEPQIEKPLPTRKISLKMSNVDVAVLLRALARAADQNIILNEKVTGKANISISQAPWDQVFLGVLNAYGLSYTWQGDIIRIMTPQDVEEELKREAREREKTLAEPTLTRIIPIKFSTAEKLRDNLEKFLTIDKDDKPIGSILVDDHTNSLIIQAIRKDMKNILAVVEQLDRPTPQVLIEAYIVEAIKDVARELGVQWGGVHRADINNNNLWLTGSNSEVLGQPISQPLDPTTGLVVDLPASSLSGFNPFTLGLVFENTGRTILAVQLSALQDEGKLNILSSPSITTLDNQTAFIESGQDVPFQTVEDGEVKIEYKKAVLSLRVTPHVIDDGTLKMYIRVNKDEVDFTNTVLGNPTIITKNAETNVIQSDGQTIVIGGLNKETTGRSKTGVPFLQDIPGLGYLFRTDSTSDQFEDLLIFITPHILKAKPADG